MKNFTVTVKKEITYGSIADLLVSAFEGGSNYWIDHVKINRGKLAEICNPWKGTSSEKYAGKLYCAPFTAGGSLEIFDIEQDGKKCPHVLNLETLQKGLEIMANKYPKHFADFIAEDGDATTGDIFLQCCVLGDCLYG